MRLIKQPENKSCCKGIKPLKNNTRKKSVVATKVCVSLLTLAVLGLSLSGCGVNGLFPLTPQQIAVQQTREKQQNAEKLKKACANADVLLSNLSKPESDPIYSLSPGVICHG